MIYTTNKGRWLEQEKAQGVILRRNIVMSKLTLEQLREAHRSTGQEFIMCGDTVNFLKRVGFTPDMNECRKIKVYG